MTAPFHDCHSSVPDEKSARICSSLETLKVVYEACMVSKLVNNWLYLVLILQEIDTIVFPVISMN